MPRAQLDVHISGSAGFYVFSVRTRRAQSWVRRHVDLAPYQGSSEQFCCDDTRMAMEIADAMIKAKLRVQ